MRILVLSQLFPPDLNGGATRVAEMARAWAQAGHDVTVGTSFSLHPHGRLRREDSWKLTRRERWNGVCVHRSWRLPAANKGVVLRTISFLTMMVMLVLAHGLRARRFDVVIATSPPLFVGVSGWIVALLGRVPLVLEIRDRWPQQAVELGILKQPVVIRLAEGLERFLYRRAQLVVVVTESVSRALTGTGVPPQKVVIIPNGADCERLHPCSDRCDARLRLGWGHNLTASYVGTMGLSQGLAVLVEAAKELQRRRVSVQVAIVGDGADRDAIRQLASMSSVRLSDPVHPERVAELYAATDIGIVVLRNLPLFAGTVPSKLYEYMACGIPVIAGVRGEAAAIVEEARAGLVVQPDDSIALADAIERLATDGEARVEMGRAGRRWVKAHRDRRTLADQYLDHLQAVSA